MTQADDTTLIMTVLNEERGLASFLESVQRQSEQPARIIVVDGGSSDRTVEIFRQWSASVGIDVEVIVEPGANISRGRNVAIAAVDTDLVAITDAGTTLHHDWLRELRRKMTPEVDVVSGFFRPYGTNTFEKALAAAITPTLSEIDPGSFLPSSRSLLLRKSAWTSAGGYPEWLDYCEDLIFDLEMRRRGQRFAFAPQALVSWQARPDLRAYAKQYYRYARGDGKSGLWPKRHIARYATYIATLGLIAVPNTRRAALQVGALGYVLYGKKFHSRLAQRTEQFDSRRELLKAHALVPTIIVVGDTAKMIGYPAGMRWRIANRRVDASSD